MGPALAKTDIVELIRRAMAGDKPTIIMFVIVGCVVVGMALFQKITGTKMFSKKARRDGRRRRGLVVWEYERDRD